MISEILRPGDTVWEGGAHVGAHTIALAALVAPAAPPATETVSAAAAAAAAAAAQGHVHAWEPHPLSRALLGAALALNGLVPRAVTVHEEALGAVEDHGRRIPARRSPRAG